MTQLLDYHVGLLRGYLLATNAHQQILHVLEVLLEGYKSKAGEIIGEKKIDVRPVPMPDVKFPPTKLPEGVKEVSNFFWTNKQVEFLQNNYHLLSAKQIAEKIGRPPSTIYQKAKELGLTKKKDLQDA